MRKDFNFLGQINVEKWYMYSANIFLLFLKTVQHLKFWMTSVYVMEMLSFGCCAILFWISAVDVFWNSTNIHADPDYFSACIPQTMIPW